MIDALARWLLSLPVDTTSTNAAPAIESQRENDTQPPEDPELSKPLFAV
jgi:hypothetical protein